tara:strand:- start:2743 stop:2862 length:120 start_codon:yes stop_codon:yes gene_type:complete
LFYFYHSFWKKDIIAAILKCGSRSKIHEEEEDKEEDIKE